MEKSLEFERMVITLVAEELEKQGVGHAEFGRFIFGESTGARIWRQCRVAVSPRRLSLAETYKIAEFFDISIGELLWNCSKEWDLRKKD